MSEEYEWFEVLEWDWLTHNRRGLHLVCGPRGGLTLSSKNELHWWDKTPEGKIEFDKDHLVGYRIVSRVDEGGVFVRLEHTPTHPHNIVKRDNTRVYNNIIHGLRYHQGLRHKMYTDVARIQYQAMAELIYPGLF